MALTKKQRLQLASAQVRKRKTEEERVAEIVAFVNQSVETQIRHGKDGRDGKDGIGIAGKDGRDGLDGRHGRDGKDGVTEVLHEYKELPDSIVHKDDLKELLRRVEKVEKTPVAHIGPSSAGIKYVKITTPEYRVGGSELLHNGITIFGVNYSGDVDIYLPAPKKNQIVYVNDESGTATTNNITVRTV